MSEYKLRDFEIETPFVNAAGSINGPNKALVNNANRYAMAQMQVHVVLDANHNARKVRQDITKEAAEHGAAAIVVWVQTPLDIAKKRTEVRKITEGHELFEHGLVEKMAKRLEEPDEREIVITIDGQATADEQQKSFDEQLRNVEVELYDR